MKAERTATSDLLVEFSRPVDLFEFVRCNASSVSAPAAKAKICHH